MGEKMTNGFEEAGKAPARPWVRPASALEEAVVVALLKFPVLAPTIDAAAVVENFTNPDLCWLGSAAITLARTGEIVDPGALLSSVKSDALRARLTELVAREDGGLDEYAEQIGRVLDKVRMEILKQRKVAALVGGHGDAEREKRRALEDDFDRALVAARERAAARVPIAGALRAEAERLRGIADELDRLAGETETAVGAS